MNGESVTIGDCTLYCGDAREIVPTLPDRCVDAVMTDPVWPNASETLTGSDDPYGLFASVAEHSPRVAERVVVHMGCNSDPRFLRCIPDALPFLRVCWLRNIPSPQRGRLLIGSEVAYVFGQPPPVKLSRMILSGECATNGDRHGRGRQHPTPRSEHHTSWLVARFAGSAVLDPFMGAGTTGAACALARKRFIGIEIERAYFDVACDRIARAYAQGNLFLDVAAEQKQLTFPARRATKGRKVAGESGV